MLKKKKNKSLWGAPSKHFIKNMQIELLQKALSPWPRRSAPLLEVNCGSGDFLPFLWKSGFDIIAVEANSELRIIAESKKIWGLEFYSASDDDLPFMEDSFDWVILHLRHMENLIESINEAVRVAKRGIMLTFWNKISLPVLFGKSRIQHSIRIDQPVAWSKVWSKLRTLRMGRITTLSVLFGPSFTWSARCPISSINNWFSQVPIGGWCIIRLDFGAFTPFTAIPLRLGKQLQSQEPALEYVDKTMTTSEDNEDIH